MLMLLSVHVTSVLFSVRFNNFALTMGFYWSYTLSSSCPFLCALAQVHNTANKKMRYTAGKEQCCHDIAKFHNMNINEPHLPYKRGLDVMQSHPLRRTRFGQYQALSATLGQSQVEIEHYSVAYFNRITTFETL